MRLLLLLFIVLFSSCSRKCPINYTKIIEDEQEYNAILGRNNNFPNSAYESYLAGHIDFEKIQPILNQLQINEKQIYSINIFVINNGNTTLQNGEIVSVILYRKQGKYLQGEYYTKKKKQLIQIEALQGKSSFVGGSLGYQNTLYLQQLHKQPIRSYSFFNKQIQYKGKKDDYKKDFSSKVELYLKKKLHQINSSVS